MAVPRPEKEPEVSSRAGVIAGDLVTREREGEVLAAIPLRREGDSPAQRQVEVVLAVDDAADYGPVRGVLTPHQLDAVGVVLGDEPALHGLGGPGEHDSRTHAVEAQGFDGLHETQVGLGIVDTCLLYTSPS